ncbi:hypothetical protein SB757_33320, partial [Pseudomonas sp. SIMBA_065]
VNEAAQAASAHSKRDMPTGGANGTHGASGTHGSNGASRVGAAKGRQQRWRLLAAELGKAFAGGDRTTVRRVAWWGGAGAAV